MFEAPGRKALIETALAAFQDDILPSLDGDRKYLGLMIASAREGLYDTSLTGPVHTLLTVLAEEKLKLSNPKFLAAREYSQPTPN